tara:strand:- start:1216 stop:1560 length:345 start_codon:yes stop_codon:yes gene_type:complete
MNPTKFNAVLALVGGEISQLGNGEFLFRSGQKPPTEKAIQAKLTELQNAEPMRVLREERNEMLKQTDWRASSDLTLSSEWATYRQALRDLPSTATPTLDDDGNLQNVTWPDEPT